MNILKQTLFYRLLMLFGSVMVLNGCVVHHPQHQSYRVYQIEPSQYYRYYPTPLPPKNVHYEHQRENPHHPKSREKQHDKQRTNHQVKPDKSTFTPPSRSIQVAPKPVLHKKPTVKIDTPDDKKKRRMDPLNAKLNSQQERKVSTPKPTLQRPNPAFKHETKRPKQQDAAQAPFARSYR
ncbi:hypothetical protein THMIRHAS_01680 [Thiosulfatimonas sediminis]|uniref:Uncharacterized protein n=1 Tax=Thiosulfatimonas sediminis TaxID=2675054 RepID=A0A6F8PRQ1_9GAMM|nr:hypothetical protein [Thiosulfatimonas sediminis]BBP44795.1 hypothetical protein THMIRHAS_01680 [Thiosulfatimonas sediminis]